MIKRIATVSVYVEDQQEAIKFWTEQVGFELRRNDPMGPGANWVEVAPAGLVFECTDFQATYEGMVKRGVKFLEEPKSMPWGTFVRFQDSDGNEYLLKG